LTPQHVLDYQAAAAKLPEWLEWLEGEEWQRRANSPGHGLLLRNSVVLSMPDYLRGLWLSLQQIHGSTTLLTWEQRTFSSSQAAAASTAAAAAAPPAQAAAYDVIVLASGAGIRAFPSLKDLPVELVKGRTLLVDQQQQKGPKGQEGKEEEQFLGSALLCGEYVVPGVDVGREGEEGREGGIEKRVLRCGSTKEYMKDPWGQQPEEEGGREGEEKMKALREKAERIYPPLKGGPAAYRITTGIRVATQRSNLGKLPILGRISLRGGEGGGEGETWLYTGLGGRGLIHHAYLGECLAQAILKDEEMLLPSQVRAPLEKD
jgi:glycine/D-amino acid oxidase-like deaminating enzyme